MPNTNRILLTLALAIGTGVLFALPKSDAEEKSQTSHKVRITVTDVLNMRDSIVKHIRIELDPGSRVTIKSDDTELSTVAGNVTDQPDQGIVTVAVLADHLEWGKPKTSAFKFMVALSGNGGAKTSETWPVVAEKQLEDLITVSLKSGDYELDTAIPLLRFKDVSYTLTVTPEPSNPETANKAVNRSTQSRGN